ncbi:MCE family protein [Rhodococcus sp. D2-41]|uniref:MCE family protein n=1 Tax=Speluncibacter jeojiensis TaxID=2710754 RepID=A0A9X4RDR6_9ACTN|nr:MlaD family protein [Rhodococcus sp. D2-41]MDG3011518.1 MCE family protein [Rhodococcus sp. D2-41]MDG3015125.1 MCE family protein [Corynebacteriales bacterium D3-21]
MMLTRFVRIQLAIFLVLTIIGVSVMALSYVHLPALFGVGRYEVTVQMPQAGGLYKYANVAYRGNNVGKVTAVDLTDKGVDAKLSINSDVHIPKDTLVQIRSVSAIGEQYVEFLPKTDSKPYLKDGSVIPQSAVQMPDAIGPILDQANALLASVPKDQLNTVIDESFLAFNGAGPDLHKLIESTHAFVDEATKSADPTKTLLAQLGPLLNTQEVSSDAIRQWTKNLASVTGQLRKSDPDIRSLIEKSPAAMQQATQLMQDIKPTLPILLSNLISVGQVGVTYNASIQQLLVVYPALTAALQTLVQYSATHDNMLPLDFHLELNAPPACTTGYLPADQRRSPSDLSVPNTPDGLYCKAPQNDPSVVRGARNLPCMDHPGKRAATPAECDDPRGYVPEGTNPPFGPPQPVAGSGAAPAQPASSTTKPTYDTATYDPGTGRYVGPDGNIYADRGLVQTASGGTSSEKGMSWQAMMTSPTG